MNRVFSSQASSSAVCFRFRCISPAPFRCPRSLLRLLSAHGWNIQTCPNNENINKLTIEQSYFSVIYCLYWNKLKINECQGRKTKNEYLIIVRTRLNAAVGTSLHKIVRESKCMCFWGTLMGFLKNTVGNKASMAPTCPVMGEHFSKMETGFPFFLNVFLFLAAVSFPFVTEDGIGWDVEAGRLFSRRWSSVWYSS